MTKPLQLAALEKDRHLFDIATSSFYFDVVCLENSSQAPVIGYLQFPDILNWRRPGFAFTGQTATQMTRIFVCTLIPLRAHSTRRSCRNALRSLSTLLVTLSFACPISRRTNPRYSSDNIFSPLTLEGKLLHT